MSNTGNDRIERLCELLGFAVLLPWSAGSKGGNRKWNHRQLADMNDATYLAKLEKTRNIGVSLRKVSNRLVMIDIDDDKFGEPFLETNPGGPKVIHLSAGGVYRGDPDFCLCKTA